MTIALNGPLLLVGAGKMGGALLEGWLARGLDPRSVFIQDPALPEGIGELVAAHGIVAGAAPRLPQPPAVIVLAVKPALAGEVLSVIAPSVGAGTVVLSIAAGRTLESLSEPLPETCAVVRAMPNTPASVGEGITVCVANAHVSEPQRQACETLLAAVGEVVWVDEEALMDAVTAVSGSGPAYVFHLVESLEQAGIEAGLPAELAARLARGTVAGAGALLKHSEQDATTLRTNVTSPNGTTAAALEVLMKEDALKRLLARAVAQAAKRSRELSS
ncbi:pyrroline-5-carboxylate reductase [Methyloceanibacter caenitepidi]|uniref:Pyrroline-5-carboxylate reductase n=1 Tax=Methyloceanibacter caenitepidi TaxID=1384459 RepID=A0A0A8K6G1_9HYPH|nr:pyrroline-5-carboxylate reductase [Methyloceanibacter caenitepidi]BAQ18127.1 pyrroline-5-carboxylate reductase [Methyloceanibacter caenitepidi]